MEEPKLYIVNDDGTAIELDCIKRAEALEADSSTERVMESKPTCLEYVIDSNDGLKLLLTIEGIIANSDGKYNFKAFYLKDREVQAIEFNGLDGDELADAVLRICDFAGLRGWELDSYEIDKEAITEHEIMTESLMPIVLALFVPIGASGAWRLQWCLANIEKIAEQYGIDLAWHIELKMRFNELRERLHGCKY